MRILAKAVIPLGLGLLCSCATHTSHSGQALLAPGLPSEQILGEKTDAEAWLILTLHLSDGQAVPCFVDTGASSTILDQSLEGLLGRRLRAERLQTPFGAVGLEEFGVYAAPKLYLGNVPFMTGPTVLAGRLIGPTNRPYKAILGMDCLRHYCIQIDFDEHKIRFLDSNALKREELGVGFPLRNRTNLGAVPMVDIKWATNGNVRLIVDTGMERFIDFSLPPAVVRPALLSHAAFHMPMTLSFSSDKGSDVYLFPTVVLGSETYQNVQVVQGDIAGGLIDGFMALPFLARHKVTFDFPNQKMYLRLR